MSIKKSRPLLFALFYFSAASISFAADMQTDFNVSGSHPGTRGAEMPKDAMEPDTSANPCNSQGSPVYLRDLTFVWTELDVSFIGTPYLHLSRSYNSFDPRDGIFGKGWTGSCERALVKTFAVSVEENENGAQQSVSSPYSYSNSDGRRYDFTLTEDGYVSPDGMAEIQLLERAGGGAELVMLDGSKEVYSAQGLLTAEIDANGNTLNYTYEEGALTRVADEHGRFIDYAYDSAGRVAIVSDHAGRQWLYGYNAEGALLSVTAPDGGVHRYEYEEFSPPASGAVYQLLTKVTDASGVVLTQVTYTAEGKVRTYSETANTITYQESSGFIFKTDSVGSQWRFKLDEDGRKVEVRDPLGFITRYDYDENGNAIEFVDEISTLFNSEFDILSRMFSSTTPDGTTTFEYLNRDPYPSKITTPSGREANLQYDSRNNLTQVTDPAGFVTRMRYNARGYMVGMTDALGQESRMDYNAIGLMTSMTNEIGETTTRQFDNRGNLLSMTNARGETMTYEYDIMDRTIAMTDPRGRTTRYIYDLAGKVLTINAANDTAVSYEYDIHGRTIRRIDFDGLEELYTYRSDNLMASYTDRAGQLTSYIYDADKRITRMTVDTLVTTTQYDPRDLPIRIQNETSTVTMAYDDMLRVIREVNNTAVDYGYNNEGEKVLQSALGRNINHDYDVRGLLISIINDQIGEFQYSHDALGRRDLYTRPSGDTTEYRYDAFSQLIRQIHSGSFNADYGYGYDNANRLTAFQGDGTNKSYGYNPAGEVIDVIDNQGNKNFDFDQVGNRISDGGTYNETNHLLENNRFTFAYDLNGNLTEKIEKATGRRTVYIWNARDQLLQVERYPNAASITPESVKAFTYGPLGRRWSRTDNGERNFFAYAGMDRIATLDNRGNEINYFTFGGSVDEPIAMEQGGETFFYFTDYLGSVKAITDGANVVAAYDYAAFGNTVVTGNDTLNPFRYTAREFEEEDLYYYRARYYDPDLGRFISSDPIDLAGGINEYIYTLNSPLNATDPTGETVAVAGVAFVCIVGGLAIYTTTNMVLNLICGPNRDQCFASQNRPKVEDNLDDFTLPGEALSPPGTCTRPQLDRLEDIKKAACNQKRSCKISDGCSDIALKMTVGQQCVNARNKINSACYKGGNKVHVRESMRAGDVLGECAKIGYEKGCKGFGF